MNPGWLLKRLAYLGLLMAVPAIVTIALVRGWDRVIVFLNGGWPPWVGNVANVLQIATPIVALAWALARITRSRTTAPADGSAPRVLRILALLLPARDRERFVGEVRSILADYEPRQRLQQLLSVAAAVPGLAVILRWARRRA